MDFRTRREGASALNPNISFEDDSEASTRHHRCRREEPPPVWGPNQQEQLMIQQLRTDLLAETAGRGRFEAFFRSGYATSS